MNPDDLAEFKNQGNLQAAALWEVISAKVPPYDPVDLYKAVCTIKAAELLTRVRFSSTDVNIPALMKATEEFVDVTLRIAGGGESGNAESGFEAVEMLEELFPISESDFSDPSAFATRQHTLDGLLLLSAVRFGKEQETKTAITKLQDDFVKVILGDVLAKAVTRGQVSGGNA